jgi:hypothetical protein
MSEKHQNLLSTGIIKAAYISKRHCQDDEFFYAEKVVSEARILLLQKRAAASARKAHGLPLYFDTETQKYIYEYCPEQSQLV